MKYHTYRDCRPLTPIEEGDGDEDEDGERAPSVGQDSCTGSDQGSVSLPLTPCDFTMRPWGELMRDGNPPTLTHTLNRIIDTATIKVVGFEESFGSRLSQEARSLTWSLCEVYGKARMAIDLVEKELLTSRKEMEIARQEFGEMASTEIDLLQCVRKARSLTEIAVEDVARWRREYRRALDDNANLKLKMIRYQLHHDMMESSSVEVSHQNHSIKAFINICREKEKQCQRSSKNVRCIPREITLDNPVNGRNSCTPRKHCPKVNLSLPRPGQSALQGIPPGNRRKTNTLEKRTVEKNTFILSSNQGSQDEGASLTASLTFLADTRPHQLHYTGSAAVTPEITFHLEGTAPISSLESSGDRASDAFPLTSVPQGRGKEAVAPRERTRFELDVLTGLRPGAPRINRTSSDTSDDGRRVQITFQDVSGDVSATRKESSRQSREEHSIFPDTVTASPGPFSSPTKLCAHAQDEMKTEVYTTPSTCRYSPIPDVVTTESVYNPTISDRNYLRQHNDVAIVNRDYSFRRNNYSDCSNRCFSPFTPYRSSKLKRTSSVQERSVSYGAAYHESCTARNVVRSKSCVRESVLPVTKVQNYPSFLPPIPCRVHHPYHSKGTAPPSRDTRSLVIKDNKIVSSLPVLGNISKSFASKSATQKHMSEVMRPQQRSISGQVPPRVSSAVAPGTVYHQVLLIRSCPTEIMGKATSAASNSSKMHDNRCNQSINI
ncbi:uncharacterized protein [Haliotis cracherodii]|uniref:uncharacterized protein n=1 Tax=Haliotis cracherodii TaxID=6455 RepID=UPI0039EA2C70